MCEDRVTASEVYEDGGRGGIDERINVHYVKHGLCSKTTEYSDFGGYKGRTGQK